MSDFKPETKKSGDIIKSSDWNAAMGEIARLGTLPLTITGSLAATSGQNGPLTAVRIEPAFDAPEGAEIRRYGLVVTSGAVGIGTSAPEADLHVQGSLKLREGLSVHGFADDLEESPEGTNLVPTQRAVNEALQQARNEARAASSELRTRLDGLSTSFTTGSLTLGNAAVTGIATSISQNSTNGALPTQLAVKSYVDTQVAAVTGSPARDFAARSLALSGPLRAGTAGEGRWFSIRGTGLNQLASGNYISARLVIGDEVIFDVAEGIKRGFYLTVIDKASFNFIRRGQSYDLYADDNARTQLANDLNAITATQIGFLASFDAWQTNSNLLSAFGSLGLTQATTALPAEPRVPYCAVFDRPVQNGSRTVLEVRRTNSDNQDIAEISGYIRGGTLQELSTSSSPKRMFVNANLYILGHLQVSGRAQLLQEDWRAPILANSWVNYPDTAGHNPVAYYKDSTGVVHLRGLIRNGLVNQAAFTLPAGYRPLRQQLHGTISHETDNKPTPARIDIKTTGEVIITNANTGWVSLDGISFRAA